MEKIPKRFQNRFKRITSELAEFMKDLNKVCPAARLYVTPQEIHLLEDCDVGPNEDDRKVSTFIGVIDAGDW